MKQSNFSHFFIKAVFAVAGLTAMAGSAFAQITLDWDVLTEETPAKENTSTDSRNIPIPLKAPVVKKEEPPLLKPVKPAPAVKPKVKPAVKPAVKAPVKPEVKQTGRKTPLRPKEKYQVKETQPRDEHDRLKPHAAPVPEVKILETKNNDGSVDSQTAKEKTVQVGEPKLSKHFLEQQRLKELQKKEQTVSGEQAVQPSVTETAFSVRPQEQPKPQAATPEQLMENVLKRVPVKTEPEKQPVQPAAVMKETVKEIKKETKPFAGTAEAPSVKTPIVPEKDKIAYSVVPVSASLTPEERSSVLSLEIPSNSATFKALSAQRTLYAVFRFERKSLELTHEMQTVLNDIAVQMKKNRKKRLIVYSYGSPDSAEPGKERQYALRRALLIRSYLIEQGLHSLRIELRSQGQKGAGNKIPDRADLVFQER